MVNLVSEWGTPTPLTTNSANDLFPVISGDGTTIAFHSFEGGGTRVWVVNSNGMGLMPLTNGQFPSISDDGTTIAFPWFVDGDLGVDLEINVIHSDGMGLRPLTDNDWWDGDASISGDGTTIAFASGVGGDAEIYVIQSDGTEPRQLTFNDATDRNPAISGDGTTIAFESNVVSPTNVEGDYEIYVINSDGAGVWNTPTQLTHNTAHDFDPSISDDGRKIAFTSAVDGDAEIFVVSAQPLPPPWFPESELIIVVSGEGSTSSARTLS